MTLPPLTHKETVVLPPALKIPPSDPAASVPGRGDKEDPKSMVLITDGIQPVQARIVQKIDAGDFVDFAELLQNQFPQEDLSLPTSHSGVVLVQSLDSLKRKKKRITDFQSWAEALMVYVAVKCRHSDPHAGIWGHQS